MYDLRVDTSATGDAYVNYVNFESLVYDGCMDKNIGEDLYSHFTVIDGSRLVFRSKMNQEDDEEDDIVNSGIHCDITRVDVIVGKYSEIANEFDNHTIVKFDSDVESTVIFKSLEGVEDFLFFEVERGDKYCIKSSAFLASDYTVKYKAGNIPDTMFLAGEGTCVLTYNATNRLLLINLNSDVCDVKRENLLLWDTKLSVYYDKVKDMFKFSGSGCVYCIV